MRLEPRVRFTTGSRRGLVLIAILLLVPAVASFFSNHEARSRWEKRSLTSWQSVMEAPSIRQTFARLDDYLDDHMGFALTLNRWYRKMQFYWFSDSPVANVDVAAEGFLFFNSHSTKRPHSLMGALCRTRPRLAERFSQEFTALADAFQADGVRSVLAIVPSKVMLYPERLPATVPQETRQNCISIDPLSTVPATAVAELSSQGYEAFYPILEMKALRDEEAFYPPANFHASSKINHVFARKLLGHIGIDPGEKYSAGARLRTVRGDLTTMGFAYTVEAWRYPYAAYQISRDREWAGWVLEHYARARDYALYGAASPASERRALLLSNSFGAFFAPHLAPGFREVLHVNLNHLQEHEAAGFLSAVVEKFRPTDLIYLVQDSGIPNAPLRLLAQGLEEAVAP